MNFVASSLSSIHGNDNGIVAACSVIPQFTMAVLECRLQLVIFKKMNALHTLWYRAEQKIGAWAFDTAQ